MSNLKNHLQNQRSRKSPILKNLDPSDLEDPTFKECLVRPSGKTSAKCKACQKPVYYLKTFLQRHAETALHKRAIKSEQSGQRQGNLAQCLRQEENSS